MELLTTDDILVFRLRALDDNELQGLLAVNGPSLLHLPDSIQARFKVELALSLIPLRTIMVNELAASTVVNLTFTMVLELWSSLRHNPHRYIPTETAGTLHQRLSLIGLLGTESIRLFLKIVHSDTLLIRTLDMESKERALTELATGFYSYHAYEGFCFDDRVTCVLPWLPTVNIWLSRPGITEYLHIEDGSLVKLTPMITPIFEYDHQMIMVTCQTLHHTGEFNNLMNHTPKDFE